MGNFFIKKGEILKKIDFDEIFFFMRENSKTYAILIDCKFETDATLSYLSQVLGSNFIRTHKSYLVNINKIDYIEKYNNKTFNIKFKNVKENAYATREHIKILTANCIII